MMAIVTNLIRKGLMFVAGWIIGKGILTDDEGARIVNIIVAAIVAAIPIAWSIINRLIWKKKEAEKNERV